MAEQTIRLLGDPILRTRCPRVRDISSRAVRKTVKDLRDTLQAFRRERGFGRGIAAPQIGSTHRILYIDHQYTGPLINPRITKKSRKLFGLWDDCFSFPDLLVWVQRHESIEVSFQDEKGKRHMIQAKGSLSELLQHEIDHLEGVLAVDRAANVKDIILRSERRKARRPQ